MDIRYSTLRPDAAAFKALYDTTGWGPATRPPAFYEAALRGSWACVAGYDGQQLVAFGRIISDGGLHAFITEMIVHPDHQRRGIGDHLLQALVARCHQAGIKDIQLFCAQGKAPFYLRNGFAARPDDAPGMQYQADT